MTATTTARSARLGLRATPEQETVLRRAAEVAHKSLTDFILDAAYQAGCRRYDGAIQGFGGCPMAKDDLTGNMPTEKMLSYFTQQKVDTNTSPMSFESAYNVASRLFGEFH